MSWRLARLTFAMLHFIAQRLAATIGVCRVWRDFDSGASFPRIAPCLMHLEEPGRPDLHWRSVRRRSSDRVIL